MSERSTLLLLHDIAEAIRNIITFTSGYDLDMFNADLRTRHAVEHNFMIIGEAVARLPDSYKATQPAINWREIKDFRNVLVHEYFGVDNTIVWTIVKNYMPALQAQIQELSGSSSEADDV